MYLIEIQRNILRVKWDGTILKQYSSHVGWDYLQKMFLHEMRLHNREISFVKSTTF
jgi:hypothetical protein